MNIGDVETAVELKKRIEAAREIISLLESTKDQKTMVRVWVCSVGYRDIYIPTISLMDHALAELGEKSQQLKAL